MKIIAVTNRKGGVGKSTMSTHIAAGLATLGLNVGLVDTDSQGHAGLMLGMPEENGLFAALIEKRPLQDVVRYVPPEQYSTEDHPTKGNLYLLPSSDQTYKIPYELRPDEAFLFLERLEEMAQLFALDAILIDTNPTMTMFDGAVYLASDGYLYVTECERLAFDGIQKAVEQMQNFSGSRRRYLGRDSRVLGIIPNKFRANTFIHRNNVTHLSARFPDLVWKPVILRTIWTEASAVSELVYTYAPTGEESRSAWEMSERALEALRTWHPTETK